MLQGKESPDKPSLLLLLLLLLCFFLIRKQRVLPEHGDTDK
jgi:hypothetical protein